MEEQYRKEITWWFAELGSESEVGNYLTLFPELNSRLAKFAIGILKWNNARLIDINNPDDVSRVRLILKVIVQTPGFVAVEVSPENKIVSITSRWNTCAGDTGDFITEDELKSILGMENYNKLLCNPAENH